MNSPPTHTDPPIFIVGYSRSGTSLLRAMLNAHPRIHIAQESAFYQWLRPDRLRSCRTARDWFLGYSRTASFRLLGLDPGPIADAIPPELPRADAGRVALPLVLGERARRLGKARHGDKTPLHSQRLDAIFADFPDAAVVHVTRHPVPTVDSIARMPWGCDSALVDALLYRGVSEAVARHGARVLVVRLEDLLARPRQELARVLEHVGEPWDEAVLHHERAPVADDPPLPWLTAAAGPVRAAEPQVGMDPAVVRLIESAAAPAMVRYGYQPWPLDREPAWMERSRSYVADIRRALRFLWRVARTAPRIDDPARMDALAQVRWLFGLNPSDRVPSGWREVPDELRRRLV